MLFFRGKKKVHLVQKRNDDLTAQRQDISSGEKDFGMLSDRGFVC